MSDLSRDERREQNRLNAITVANDPDRSPDPIRFAPSIPYVWQGGAHGTPVIGNSMIDALIDQTFDEVIAPLDQQLGGGSAASGELIGGAAPTVAGAGGVPTAGSTYGDTQAALRPPTAGATYADQQTSTPPPRPGVTYGDSFAGSSAGFGLEGLFGGSPTLSNPAGLGDLATAAGQTAAQNAPLPPRQPWTPWGMRDTYKDLAFQLATGQAKIADPAGAAVVTAGGGQNLIDSLTSGTSGKEAFDEFIAGNSGLPPGPPPVTTRESEGPSSIEPPPAIEEAPVATDGFKDMGNPDDYKWLDPTGNYAAMMEHLRSQATQNYGSMRGAIRQGTAAYDPVNFGGMGDTPSMEAAGFDPQAYMADFMQNQGQLSDVAQGATSELGQSLAGIAADRSRQGGEAALAALGPGARNSGAGMAAFGESYARPFAEAQAQQQAAQLGLFGNLAGQSMAQSGSNRQFASGLQQDANTRNLGVQENYGLENVRQNQAYDFQNSLMGQNERDRQMQAAQMYGGLYGSQLGMESGMAADQGFIYVPTYIDEAGNAIAKQNLDQASKDSKHSKLMDYLGLAAKAMGIDWDEIFG